MTAKDYKLIAAVFDKFYKDWQSGKYGHLDVDDAHGALAKRLATAFGNDNPCFDGNRFLHACNVDGY